MGSDQNRLVVCQLLQRCDNLLRGCAIQISGWLICDDQSCVFTQSCAGQCETAALAQRQAFAVFTDLTGQTIRDLGEQLINGCQLQSFGQRCIIGRLVRATQVSPQGAMEQLWV